MFQQNTPEASALVTVFLFRYIGIRYVDLIAGMNYEHKDSLSRGVHVLVRREHDIGRIESEVVELGVASATSLVVVEPADFGIHNIRSQIINAGLIVPRAYPAYWPWDNASLGFCQLLCGHEHNI